MASEALAAPPITAPAAARDYRAGVTYVSPLEQLATERGAHWDRTTEDNGATVVLRLHLPDGCVIIARGPTTEEARVDLVGRLKRLDDSGALT